MGSADGIILILDIATGILYMGHQNLVTGVTFSFDGNGLVSSSEDRMMKFWDLSSLGLSNGKRKDRSVGGVAAMDLSWCSMTSTYKVCSIFTWSQ